MTAANSRIVKTATREALFSMKNEALELLVNIIDTLADTIVQATPVDINDEYKHPGNARGSWHVRTETEKLSATSLDKDGASTIASIKRGIRSLSEVETVFFDATFDQVPYMHRLERGWSKQGRGFIEAGIAAVNARFPREFTSDTGE